MADKEFDWLNPFASIDLQIGERADGIKDWAIHNRELIQPIHCSTPLSPARRGTPYVCG